MRVSESVFFLIEKPFTNHCFSRVRVRIRVRVRVSVMIWVRVRIRVGEYRRGIYY